MTALARAVAKDCDAPPVLVILPPFEQQRVGNYLLDAGFLPLLLDDPSLGLEFVTAFGGRIVAVLLGGTFATMSVEAFDDVLADAYPQIPVIVVLDTESTESGKYRLALHRPLTCDTVLQAIQAVTGSPHTASSTPLMSDVMTPLQRQAAFKAAVTLHEITMAQAASRLGVSYNHLTLVLKGERQGSRCLEEAIAVFIELRHWEVFPRHHRTE